MIRRETATTHSAERRPGAGTAGVPAGRLSYDDLEAKPQARTPALPAPGRLLASVVLALHVVIFVVAEVSPGQTRPPRPLTPARPIAIDYSKFSHNTRQHQGECKSCHKVPAEGWKKVSAFPDVTDYPGHAACVSCHRPQFFKGPRPAICSVCHSKTSPRDQIRWVFRNPATPLQFNIEFPHDKHQDVIALLRSNRQEMKRKTYLAHVGFWRDDPTQTYYNCTVCHAQPTAAPKASASGWPDGVQPLAATFKAAPSGHDSCFNCHWKGQQPVAENCSGCHKLTTPHTANAISRISLKFMHEGGGEKKVHVAECTTCHINITKSASLRGLKPDVPITSCTECHNREGLRQDLSKELIAIDKNRAFTCVYCHTSNVGSLDAPASHYLIAERPLLKRKEIK